MLWKIKTREMSLNAIVHTLTGPESIFFSSKSWNILSIPCKSRTQVCDTGYFNTYAKYRRKSLRNDYAIHKL